ncbi:MAG: diguanylate cyclase [Deltaproteobacteria bacterium]|nr:diguanylate cyclase [Deltaproteobacteria bacterium]
MPKEETKLPSVAWRRFAECFRAATGLRIAAFGRDGAPAPVEREEDANVCGLRIERGDRCVSFYRKAVQQVIQGDEPLLFRCPGGLLVFGAPLGSVHGEAEGVVALLGGGALAEEPNSEQIALFAHTAGLTKEDAAAAVAEFPLVPPRRLVELAHLAQFSLTAVVQGQSARDEFARRQAQVMTLFEVASDLHQSSSAHELQALALNTLGVLYDVPSAALLFREAHGEAFRAHTAMGSLEKALLSWRAPADAHPIRTLVESPGRPLRLDDLTALRKLGLPESVERVTLFPLSGRREDVLGLLAVVNVDLPPDDEQLIRGFTIQLALAVDNQRLHAEVLSKGAELRAIQTLSRQFLSCLEPDALFKAILEEARKITGAQRGSLMLADNGNGELVVKAVSGINEKVVQKLRVRPGDGVSGRVFATGEPILVQNIEHDQRFSRKNRPRYSTKSFVSIPITMDERVIGVLNLSDKLSGEIFAEEDLRVLEGVAVQATIAIERSSLYQQSQELRKISITDSLTGLLNRRYFQERLAEEVDRATRHGHALSLIMIDIDHFKAYNDANGHPAGDKALMLTGRALRGSIRAIDVVSRFGGEEFAVILPETRKLEAQEIGERIRREVESLYFPGEETLPLGRLTVSLGVAGFPEDARDLKALIQKADQALYQAKDQGRNRLVIFGVSEPAVPRSATVAAAWTKVL